MFVFGGEDESEGRSVLTAGGGADRLDGPELGGVAEPSSCVESLLEGDEEDLEEGGGIGEDDLRLLAGTVGGSSSLTPSVEVERVRERHISVCQG